jgi:hypothetical protein
MTTLTTKKRDALGDAQFAFPTQRKQPLGNASHVRNAIARFNQVGGVSDAERDAAWQRIQTAARKYGVEIHATTWRQVGVTPAARRTSRG